MPSGNRGTTRPGPAAAPGNDQPAAQFSGVVGLVQGEQDQRQAGGVAVAVQQRPQRMHIVGGGGDVGALVAPEPLEQPAVVVAETAGVDLHHQAVVQAHAGHHRQHVGAEQFGVAAETPGRITRRNRAWASACDRSAVAAVGWP